MTTEPTHDDRVELELRERLTLLEDWRDQASATLGFLGLAVTIVAFTIATLIFSRRARP